LTAASFDFAALAPVAVGHAGSGLPIFQLDVSVRID
jgi:hypothetical protein